MPEETRDLQDLEALAAALGELKPIGAPEVAGEEADALTPTTEEIARAVAARYAEPPVSRYDLPTRLAPAALDAEPGDPLDVEYPADDDDPDDDTF